MSDTSEPGVLYTEHSGLAATTPVASLWSYETRARGDRRRPIVLNADGSQEYWLERSDPLLNTILPGTAISLIVNFGDLWTAGRSLVTSRLLPRVCVVGPVTQARILRVGSPVHAIGAVLAPALADDVFHAPASELVDRIVPLDDLWSAEEVERLQVSLSSPNVRSSLATLRDRLVNLIGAPGSREALGRIAPRIIRLRGGQVSIDAMARSYGLSRQQFARRFNAAAGVPPKLFARITRFQALVRTLLSTDVSRWASVPPAIGFYDQAHMINEFRAFAGSSPTVFFRPHDSIDSAALQLRGRPSQWGLPH
jgi:AraC-like DNA-binding protein